MLSRSSLSTISRFTTTNAAELAHLALPICNGSWMVEREEIVSAGGANGTVFHGIMRLESVLRRMVTTLSLSLSLWRQNRRGLIAPSAGLGVCTAKELGSTPRLSWS